MLNEFLSYVESRWPGMAAAMQSAPSVSLRYNRAKCASVPEGAAVPWCDRGRYLDERPAFTLDPRMHQGVYYVQDASSMAVGAVAAYLAAQLQLPRPVVYLDACAAPGGKTTGAVDALPQSAIVFANEYDYRRASILVENVAKWGSARTVVTRGDTARYSKLRNSFDIIAVDAPCSGEGMIRKDATAAEQWSPALVRECARRQREILANLWPALRPGGYLIYSTCTFNDEENDHIVRWLEEEFGAERVATPVEEMPGVTADAHICRFLPSRVRGEGLCLAVLQKPGEVPQNVSEGRRKNKEAKAPQIPAWLQGALPDGFVLSADGDVLRAMPADMAAVVRGMLPALDVLAAGIECGVVKGRDVVPSQALAMAADLNAEALARVELDTDTALRYLRREAIELPEGTPKGIVLLMFGGLPLGFVKNLGNRSNNLYPQNWRILH
ncbi:MAG: hypothetical protein K2I19_02025 [Muribaculaceae bacterium]|nr:hypothetical protein [Muribaculaceae bacterium]